MPIISPEDDAPIPTLRRAHIIELDRLIKEIIEQGGFGEVRLRFKRGRIYSLTYEVEILCFETDGQQRDK